MQPLIAPLFDSRSEIEVLARLLGQRDLRGYDLVRATWSAAAAGPDFDRRWNVWLSEGVVADGAHPAAPSAPRMDALAGLLAGVRRARPPAGSSRLRACPERPRRRLREQRLAPGAARPDHQADLGQRRPAPATAPRLRAA